MGTKHSREEILAAALATAQAEGLSRLSFGRVAKALGIPDRIVVYYFPTKDELIRAVMGAMGLALQQTLGAAFTAPAADHRELLRAAWPVLATKEADPVFALFFEANGLAAAGQEPYRSLVPALVEGWIEWTMGFVEGSKTRRRTEAETAIAILDGLLLLRLLVGAKEADRAARRLEIR